MFPNHSNVKCFWYVSFMGIVNNTSLGSTLAIQTSFFIILNTSRIDSILKCLYTTKSFKYFKFRINLKIPLFFFLVKTVEIKSTDSFEASTITLFLRRNLISVVIISCSETQWGIQISRDTRKVNFESIFFYTNYKGITCNVFSIFYKVLNVTSYKSCVRYFLSNFYFFTKW